MRRHRAQANVFPARFDAGQAIDATQRNQVPRRATFAVDLDDQGGAAGKVTGVRAEFAGQPDGLFHVIWLMNLECHATPPSQAVAVTTSDQISPSASMVASTGTVSPASGRTMME